MGVHALAADPVKILFVGNSYTFGRVDPVMSYNAAAVHDPTAGFNAINPTGTNSYPAGTPGFGSSEPHSWGGVPGIFKKMTDEAGLNYDVSLSTRNAASLRGQFLDTAPTGLSQTSCNTTRTIAANPNASAATKVYLEQTWARPDMVEAHKITTPDLTNADGRPMVDTSAAGGNATL